MSPRNVFRLTIPMIWNVTPERLPAHNTRDLACLPKRLPALIPVITFNHNQVTSFKSFSFSILNLFKYCSDELTA
ncbi:hypothetical protein F511_38251 [Dorcoceras hygrometricum]|uniref:Uncharacterized protein n=1 Tax=Dorcoceras hygrometricum TaxID=472368 RepID=A0A2Z7CYZ4_9LAMI|nr:hypothetical protein F511_38251 [Dorcoceras hygrometricum]